MKLSRYNWVVPYSNGYILYNGLTGSLLHLYDPSCYPLALAIKSQSDKDVRSFARNDTDLLLKEGFLVQDDFNELSYLNSLSLSKRYNPNISYIKAVCTLQCNFQCTYCFQSNLNRDLQLSMDTATVDKISKIVFDSSSNEMSLCLFGGEPLIVPDTCVHLCRSTYHAAINSGKLLSISLITNGYLLDSALLAELILAGMRKVQITIDGDERTHNSRRMLKGGGETFKRIVNNANAASHQIDTIVRVNIDDGFSYDLDSLRAALDPNVEIVYSATKYDHCGNVNQTIKNYGILESILLKEKSKSTDYIGTRYGGCIAVNRSAITVLPDGRIVKRWDELERDCSSVEPSIHNDDHMGIRQFHKWYSWNPYDGSIKECRKCKLLPNCGGGCPNQYMINRRPTCFMSESMIEQQIINMFESKMGTANQGG